MPLRSLRSRLTVAVAGAAVLVVGLAGTAWARIPDSSGVIHGCLATGGQLRVIDTASAKCKTQETGLSWNQKGVPGPAGPAGAPGPQGPAGVTGYKIVTDTTILGPGMSAGRQV